MPTEETTPTSPTPEEVTAAYSLVFAREKDLASQLLTLTDNFQVDVETLASNFPDVAQNSPAGQILTQLQNIVMMYGNNSNLMKDHYGLNVA